MARSTLVGAGRKVVKGFSGEATSTFKIVVRASKKGAYTVDGTVGGAVTETVPLLLMVTEREVTGATWWLRARARPKRRRRVADSLSALTMGPGFVLVAKKRWWADGKAFSFGEDPEALVVAALAAFLLGGLGGFGAERTTWT